VAARLAESTAARGEAARLPLRGPTTCYALMRPPDSSDDHVLMGWRAADP
jgi:hypothetical protein